MDSMEKIRAFIEGDEKSESSTDVAVKEDSKPILKTPDLKPPALDEHSTSRRLRAEEALSACPVSWL